MNILFIILIFWFALNYKKEHYNNCNNILPTENDICPKYNKKKQICVCGKLCPTNKLFIKLFNDINELAEVSEIKDGYIESCNIKHKIDVYNNPGLEGIIIEDISLKNITCNFLDVTPKNISCCNYNNTYYGFTNKITNLIAISDQNNKIIYYFENYDKFCFKKIDNLNRKCLIYEK